MRFDSPSRWNPKEMSGNTLLTDHDCKSYGWFCATGSGTVTLPTPSRELDGVEIVVVNTTSGTETISCTDGFPNNLDSVSVSAGQSVMLVCGNAGAQSYKWAVLGGTLA